VILQGYKAPADQKLYRGGALKDHEGSTVHVPTVHSPTGEDSGFAGLYSHRNAGGSSVSSALSAELLLPELARSKELGAGAQRCASNLHQFGLPPRCIGMTTAADCSGNLWNHKRRTNLLVGWPGRRGSQRPQTQPRGALSLSARFAG